MRVEDLARREEGGVVRLSARLVWEDTPREPESAWLEVSAEHADGLVLTPAPFLLAAFVPAMERGERRIRVEGELCPLLARGVRAAARSLRQWFPAWGLPAVETTAPPNAPRPPAPGVTATTMSGGVDSLATIRANHLALPSDHPAAVRDAYFLFGANTFDFAGGSPDPARLADYRARLARWQALAQEGDFRIVPVAANFRTLAPSFESWARGTMGAALAGVAHAFGGRVARMLIPSAGGEDLLAPEGTHPMLDPFHSSAALQVIHDGQWATRLEKLRLVAAWPAALAVLQPCQQIALAPDRVNCGVCNKCHRTMVELEALGRLEAAPSFPLRRLDPAFVEHVVLDRALDAACLRQCIPLLDARGRGDLARAAERRLARWGRRQNPSTLRRLRRWLRRRRRG